MDQNGKFTNGINGLGEAYDGQDEVEVELAFQVHRSEPGDLGLLQALVERYAADVTRLAGALLTQPVYPIPADDDIHEVVHRAFHYAIRHTDRFHGKASLRNWLLGITIQQSVKVWRAIQKPSRFMQTGQEKSRLESDEYDWVEFDGLPERYRLPLILRYVFGLGVEDICETLDVRPKKAHSWLVAGRHRLKGEAVESHRAGELEAYMDGLLGDNPEKRNELESHLPECEACNAYLVQLRGLDDYLRKGLQERWKLPDQTSEDREQLLREIQNSLPEQRGWHLPAIPLRQTAWLVVLLGLFAITATIMIASQPAEPENVPRRPTATPTEPLPLEVPERGEMESQRMSVNPLENYQFFTYDLAGGGDQIALVSTIYSEMSQVSPSLSQQVYLYDKKNAGLIEISQSQESYEYTNWWYAQPSLSADGRYVAYSQSGVTSQDASGSCQWDTGAVCTEIYVFDRQAGSSERISVSQDGAPADGMSFGPRLSADGRWVAFWSMAGNLTPDDGEACQPAETDVKKCLDIFLYDRQERVMRRIPVGTILYTENFGPERISLSADGRWVGFTVGAQDFLAEELGLQEDSEAVIYDRETGEYIFVNHAEDGTPGNDYSFGPVVSADGQIVTFSSRASNLVAEDTNEAVDVFVLDRQNNRVERVSVGLFGEQGLGDSGVTLGQGGFYSLDMSDDGRFIVYLTKATNFAPSGSCQTDDAQMCNMVFLFDRRTGRSEAIQLSKTDIFHVYPQVSNDGRWIGFLAIQVYCSAYQTRCVEYFLYDRQRQWQTNFIDDNFPVTGETWQEDQPITTSAQDVEVLTMSQSGKYLAAAFDDYSIGLWDNKGRRWGRIFPAKSDSPITSLAISPADDWLAAGSMDGMVYIYRASGGAIYELADHPGRVHSLLFSPDGNELLVGTPNEVWTWRRGDGKLVLANKLKYPETINKIALSPVGNLLAVASNDKSLWLQLLPSGSVITRLGGQDNVVAEVAFSPDGTLLATRALSGEVNLWKIDWQGFGALGSEFVTTIVGSNWFGNLVFSPDGKTLASGSYYEGVHIWNIADQKYFNLFSADPSQEIIHAVTFSADGSAIYTGGSGGIGVWRTFFDVAEPRYFRRSAAITDPNDLALIAEWPNHVQPIGEAGSHLDLYHADELLTFDLAVPGSLPEQVRFVEAQVLENGGGLLHYVVGSPMEVRGDLYILEYPPGSSATLLPVSEDTTVEDIRLGSIFAEYVQGNWRSGDLPTTGGTNEAQWVWDDSLPVQRLHLRIDQVFVALFYQERVSDRQPDSGGSLETSYQVGEWYPDTTLYKEDLIQIALGIDSLPPYIPGETNLIAYQIQEGDTCIGIASYFDTSVEALVELNDLPNDCSLIRTGDVLKVPVFRERLDFEGYDLDCDAQDERLQVIPALGTPGQSLVSAIYLQDASVMGLYRDTWQMTAPGEEVDNFSYPVILDLGECQSFVAVRGVGGEKPGLRIYHWENGQMALVYGHGTSLLGSDADKDTVKVMEELGDPASGTCQAWEVTYQWDGVQFNELERKSSFCGSSPNP